MSAKKYMVEIESEDQLMEISEGKFNDACILAVSFLKIFRAAAAEEIKKIFNDFERKSWPPLLTITQVSYRTGTSRAKLYSLKNSGLIKLEKRKITRERVFELIDSGIINIK
ncbi:MAG: hypothetical protein WAS72_05750 [Saprospiraceae bacterium]